MKKRLAALLLALLMLAGCTPEPQADPAPVEPTPAPAEPAPQPEPQPEPLPEPQPEPAPEPTLPMELPQEDWSLLLTHETGTAGPATEPVRWFTMALDYYTYVNESRRDGPHGSYFVGYPQITALKDKELEAAINQAIQARVDAWCRQTLTQEELNALLSGRKDAEAADAWFSVNGATNLVGSLLSVELSCQEQVSFRSADGGWLGDQIVQDQVWYLCIDLHTGRQLTSLTDLFDETVDVGALLNGKMAEQLAGLSGEWELKRPFKGLPVNFSDFFVNMTSLAITLEQGNPLTAQRQVSYLHLRQLAEHMPALGRDSSAYLDMAEPAMTYLMENDAIRSQVTEIQLGQFKGGGVRLTAGASADVMEQINRELAALEAAVADGSILSRQLRQIAGNSQAWLGFDGWALGYGDLITVQYHLYVTLNDQYYSQNYCLTFDRFTGRRFTAADLLNEAGRQYVKETYPEAAGEILAGDQLTVTWQGCLEVFCNSDLQYETYRFQHEHMNLELLFH